MRQDTALDLIQCPSSHIGNGHGAQRIDVAIPARHKRADAVDALCIAPRTQLLQTRSFAGQPQQRAATAA